MTPNPLQRCVDCGKPEIWLAVSSYEGVYEISSHGRVKSLPRAQHQPNGGVYLRAERIMRVTSKRSGHLYVQLWVGGEFVHRAVHRLVLEAFVGLCPLGRECCHHDGCATHNHPANLRWGTRRENWQDAVRHGTTTTTAAGKLTPDDVRAIRASGLTHQTIADQYGISRPQISKVKLGHTYKNV